MKTVIFSLATLILAFSNGAFSQSQLLEPLHDLKKGNKQELLYCGMVYHDDSTKVQEPKKQREKTPVTRKQSKKSLPTKTEKPVELRREG